MVRKNLFCGVLTAFVLFCFIVTPLTAGGKQEKTEKSETKSEQESKTGETEKSEEEATPITAGSAPASQAGPAAVVEGEEISMKRYNEVVNYLQFQYMQQGQRLQGAQLEQVKEQSLELLINQEVLYQVAKNAGYSADEALVQQQLEQLKAQSGGEEQFQQGLAQRNMSLQELKKDLRKRVVWQQYLEKEFETKIDIGDADAKVFYEENPDYFTEQEQVETKHIIIQVDEDAPEDKVAEARKKIEEVQEELERGGDFEELAREYSEGPSSKDGGSLGFIQRGQMVPPFEKTAFSLGTGEVSDIIRTQFGFHIVKVTERKEEQLSPFEEVKSDIVNHLKTVRMDEEVQVLLEKKKKEMDIERKLLNG